MNAGMNREQVVKQMVEPNAPYGVKSSWDRVHGLYVFTFRAGDEERKLFIAEEMVHLMFDGQPEQPEGYTLAELVDLAPEDEDEDEELTA